MLVNDLYKMSVEEIVDKTSKREEVEELLNDCAFERLDSNYVEERFDERDYQDVVLCVFEDTIMSDVADRNPKTDIYDKYYAKEHFIRVLDKDVPPETRWVEGSNFVDVNFKIDERTKRIIAMGALDNLVKGAAGQAVQNMNLIFGLPETMGLEQAPMFP